MHPTIAVRQHGRSTLWLTVVEPLLVGRECDGLLLGDEKVSRQHVQLTPAGSSLTVTDLRSTNGAFIDGVRVNGEATLQAGATLRLGDTTIAIENAPLPIVSASTTRRDVGGTIVATVNPETSDPAQPAHSTGDPVVRPRSTAGDTRRTSMDEIVASFGGQPIGLPSGSADDTVTIMFSDIESSTELALGMGDNRWYQMLTWHNQLVEQRVAAHGGFIVKNQGDGFMITFNSARRAIICASEIQQALHHQGENDPSSAMRVRIGMHTGEAIRQDSGDLFGRHVIIAARVGGLAQGGQILVSSISREIASARGDLHFGEPVLAQLKGVGEQYVSPVLWGGELPAS